MDHCWKCGDIIEESANSQQQSPSFLAPLCCSCAPNSNGNSIECDSPGIQVDPDVAYSKGESDQIIAEKTIFLFGTEVQISGQGETMEEAKKDLEDNIKDTKRGMWE